MCGSILAEATTFPSSRVERSTGPREEEGRLASRVSWVRQLREWTESPTWGGRREMGWELGELGRVGVAREEGQGGGNRREDLGQEGQGDVGCLPEGGEEAALLHPGLHCPTGLDRTTGLQCFTHTGLRK